MRISTLIVITPPFSFNLFRACPRAQSKNVSFLVVELIFDPGEYKDKKIQLVTAPQNKIGLK